MSDALAALSNLSVYVFVIISMASIGLRYSVRRNPRAAPSSGLWCWLSWRTSSPFRCSLSGFCN